MNPTAGKHQSVALKEKIVSKFESLGITEQCIIRFTERPLHATEMAKEYALQYGADAIIFACGGDGTVNEVSNGVIGTDAAMSVLPAGTGNDFVKSLFSTLDPNFMIEHILDYKTKTIDSGTLDGRTFVNISSLGFDTIVGDKAKQLVSKARFLGGFSYFIAVFLCLFGKNYSRMKFHFEAVDKDGNDILTDGDVEFVLAAIANGQYYGSVFHPCPTAELSDGLFDILIVDRLSPLKILPMIPKYMKGTAIHEPVAHLHKVKRGTMEGIGEKLLVNCDGESYVAERVEFDIVPNSIRIAYY
jgi:YegS/Rv2252/BmrU family lipid kinase